MTFFEIAQLEAYNPSNLEKFTCNHIIHANRLRFHRDYNDLSSREFLGKKENNFGSLPK